jgi:hypothetical protein
LAVFFLRTFFLVAFFLVAFFFVARLFLAMDGASCLRDVSEQSACYVVGGTAASRISSHIGRRLKVS